MNIEMNINEDANKSGWNDIKKLLDKIEEGGGKKAIQKQKERNKLTARERIEYLLDKDKYFIQIGAFAGYGMYEEYGGCPAGGTVAGVVEAGELLLTVFEVVPQFERITAIPQTRPNKTKRQDFKNLISIPPV